MAKDLNRVMVIGRLGTEPEMRYTPTGTATTSFRIAVNRRSRTQEGQEPREETDWFTVVTWQKLAEIASQYLAKGARVYVEGRLQTRSWEGQDGQKRYATEIIANDMIMLDSRQAAGVASGRSGDDEVEDIATDTGDIPF